LGRTGKTICKGGLKSVEILGLNAFKGAEKVKHQDGGEGIFERNQKR